jgi:CheY-like chemotaxis protein
MSENELIDIYDVARIFNLSVETIRKYKQIGLVKAHRTIGRKDFFDRSEIIIRKKHIECLRKDGLKIADITSDIKRFEEAFPKYISFKKGQKKILIIEDEKALSDIIMQAMSTFFEEEVVTAYAAEDGTKALDIAKQIEPDLIICDVVLDSSISGIQLHSILKSEPATKNAEYIFISGNIRYNPENTIFLQKPFFMKDLIKAVKDALGIQAGPGPKVV